MEEIIIIKLWHAFNSQKLQNIDGKGTDLMPLPNICNPIPNIYLNLGITLNYKELLISDSLKNRVVFIYSGANLSEQQKQKFEDLHLDAQKVGGQLYVFSFEDYFENLVKTQIDPLSISSKQRDHIVDTERLFVLKNCDIIAALITEKYKLNFNREKVSYLYVDHDMPVDKNLQYIATIHTKEMRMSIKTTLKPNNSIHLLFDIDSIYMPTNSKFFSDLQTYQGQLFSYKGNYSLLHFCKDNGPLKFLVEEAKKRELTAIVDQCSTIPENGADGNELTLKVLPHEYEKAKQLVEEMVQEYTLASYQGEDHHTLWKQDVSSLILKDFYQAKNCLSTQLLLSSKNLLEKNNSSFIIDLRLTNASEQSKEEYSMKIFFTLDNKKEPLYKLIDLYEEYFKEEAYFNFSNWYFLINTSSYFKYPYILCEAIAIDVALPLTINFPSNNYPDYKKVAKAIEDLLQESIQNFFTNIEQIYSIKLLPQHTEFIAKNSKGEVFFYSKIPTNINDIEITSCNQNNLEDENLNKEKGMLL